MSHGIQPGDRVTLHYRIASYGQEIANTLPATPETFTVGGGEIDARLEQLLIGLAEGAREVFALQPWQAFGERDEALVQTLPRQDFPAELPLGHQVECGLPNGETWIGTIVEVGANTVKLDFNHPLAGLPVEFAVQILAIDHAQ